MERYAVFLRGINISGKNRLVMSELKKALEEQGFSDVFTYLNSGNVLLSAEDRDAEAVRSAVEELLICRFGLTVPLCVLPAEELGDILARAPEWWGTKDKETYDNLIFILTGDTAEEVARLLGEPSEGLERVEVCGNVMFWTFDRKNYQKCNWWKRTAAEGIGEKLTIRTANTVRKLCR